MSWFAVGLGAMLGAWIRWGLSEAMNNMNRHVPLGTLAVNLVGGYLIGIALAYFGTAPAISPHWRLFAVTGFLGGLTTFSAFSGEALMLLQRGDYGWALGHSALHLLGSIACCIAGYASYRALAS
jgi:CrcB protein